MRLLRALGDRLDNPPTSLGTRPLELTLQTPLPTHARFYTYTVHGDTHARQWRIQLWGTAPAKMGNRFDWSDAHMVYLLGWAPNYNVWVVYDARAQEGPNGFTFNRACSVDRDAVVQGAIDGYHRRRRQLHQPMRDEDILIATPRNLTRALVDRFRQHLTTEDHFT